MSYPGQIYNVPGYNNPPPAPARSYGGDQSPYPANPAPQKPQQQQQQQQQQPAVNYRSCPYPVVAPPVAQERAIHSQVPSYYPTQPLPPPPPQQAINYTAANGGHYQYQYSQCTGKRKALLIGINYFGTKNQLNGCINDVRKIAPFIHDRYGFAYEDMIILTDDQQDQRFQPTRANIIRAMHWLVKDARPNDSLFFHFSGHGGQTEDLDGDESDGLDETIYPADFKKVGMIVDDEMHDIMVKPLPAGCRLTAIFDCCHSGSALDLPYEYGASGALKEHDPVHDTAKGIWQAVGQYARGDVDGVVQTGLTLFNKFTQGKKARELSRRTKASPADVIQFSGCKDDQKSADTTEGGEATGAMSWALREALTRQPNQSYASLLVNVRELLAARYSQKPMLSASHPIDTSLKFVL